MRSVKLNTKSKLHPAELMMYFMHVENPSQNTSHFTCKNKKLLFYSAEEYTQSLLQAFSDQVWSLMQNQMGRTYHYLKAT